MYIRSCSGYLEPTSVDFVPRLSQDCNRLEYIVTLCEALKESARTLLETHKNAFEPIVSKLSKGIATLPDELLAHVFKFATLDEHEGTRHAMMLSHVSQRFRRIAVEDRSLWSTLFAWYDTTKEGVQNCISRAGDDTDLHVVLNRRYDLELSSCSEFIDQCSAEASRWKSLTLICDWEEWETETIGYTLKDLMGECELGLSRLHELCLIERRRRKVRQLPWLTSDAFFYDEGSWTVPNVRVLRCSGYIPPQSLPFESLTRFTLYLFLISDNAVDQLMHLCTFLSGAGNLEEMDLELIDEANDNDELTTDDSDTISLPSLTTFRLSFQRFYSQQSLRQILEPFLKTLEMPILNNFSLSTDLSEVPAYLIPDPAAHPHISTLILEAPRFSRAKKITPKEIHFDSLAIPIDKIPNVSSLSITTTLGRVKFQRGQLFQRRFQPVQAHGASRLRVLTLESCRNLDVCYLPDLIISLKDVGAWDGLERVEIRSCGSLEYDAVAKVFEKEKKCFSMS